MITRLTAEQIAELRRLWDSDPDDTGELLEAIPVLLSAAERLVELESALEFLSDDGSKLVTDYRRPGELDLALTVHNIMRKAELLGWSSPVRADTKETT